MDHENNGCVGHPITNLLMLAACAPDMATADHADHGAVVDLAVPPAPAAAAVDAAKAVEAGVEYLARVEGKVDLLLSHFGLLNTGS